MFKKINVLLVASLLVLSVAGCSGRSAGTEAQAETEAAAIQTENTVDSGQEGAQAGAVGELPDLEIRFGYDGEPFILRMIMTLRQRLREMWARLPGICQFIIMTILKIMKLCSITTFRADIPYHQTRKPSLRSGPGKCIIPSRTG